MLKAFNVQFLHVITNFPPTPHNFRVYARKKSLKMSHYLQKHTYLGILGKNMANFDT